MTLQGRVALVTGGGRGIGRGIALGLAEDGADVAVTYRRDAEAAREVVDLVTGMGRGALAISADVSVPDDNRRTVEEVVAHFGQLDILVNNGGIASRGRSVADTDPEELLRVVSTHALGPHNLCAQAIPHLRQRPRSDIVMISSVATLSFGAGGAPYNMGKAAMEALAWTLAKEERPHGMHVNVVAPGLVESEMGKRLARATAGVDDIRDLDARMPFGRVCQPEDVANVVRFLVSDQASYLTGERLNVYGGGQDWRSR